MKYYTQQHEWVEVQGGTAKVGISVHAAQELGDITFIELPEMGADLGQGDALGVVESVKAAADVYSPVSGKVFAVNEELEDSPEIVNESAEDKGWICELDGVDEAQLSSLMDEAAYAEFIKE